LNDHYTTQPSQIVMYATEYCSDCRRAKAFFEANGIEYLRVGIEGNEEATKFIMTLNNGYQSVPTIIFPDGAVLGTKLGGTSSKVIWSIKKSEPNKNHKRGCFPIGECLRL
jgi:mycoredoxin